MILSHKEVVSSLEGAVLTAAKIYSHVVTREMQELTDAQHNHYNLLLEWQRQMTLLTNSWLCFWAAPIFR